MKAKYVIMNSDEEYFVRILENNKIYFNSDKRKACELSWEEGWELVIFIENKIGEICDLQIQCNK